MGLEPDCVTCAKGITGAYMPIAGIIMGEEFNRRLDLGNESQGLVRPWRHASRPCGVGGGGRSRC